MATFTHDGDKIPLAPKKDPDSIIDYGCNWAAWLPDGETIIASQWIVAPGLTVVSESFTTALTSVTLSSGDEFERYEVTNRITTSGGLVEDRTMIIPCAHK